MVRERGSALLFERPEGSSHPLGMNLFGSADHIELILGRASQAIGTELVTTLQRLNSPS